MTTHGPIYQMVEEVIKNDLCTLEGWSVLDIILIKIQELEPVWISVEDRLPREDERVLVLCDGDLQHIGNYSEDHWFDYYQGFELGTPTHWMTLPTK